MKRKVILEGEIGDRFGREFTINADSFKDVVRCLNSNFPDFHKYLLEADEKGVGFTFQVGESALSDERELLLHYPEGAMVISAVPAGSKSGGAKILAAILIVAVIGLSNGFGAAGWLATGSTFAQTAGAVALGFATNLAMSGFQQIMAPDPATDNTKADEAYLFQGTGQVAIEGDPVPILYGKLRVPGRPISVEVKNLNQSFTQLNGRTIATPAEQEADPNAPSAPPVQPGLDNGGQDYKEYGNLINY
tara:strand:+ start:4440 stop:5183 length:744 start_codon:yes stop_codon:yes gene_type:complete